MIRRLILMGSGEISATMVGVHRDVLTALGPDPSAVLLDTPYGFQENADELTGRICEYFEISLAQRMDVAPFRSARVASALQRESMVTAVRIADYVFSGPGSPTYALEQWEKTTLSSALADKLVDGGAVVFASAAALTLGEYVIPVYEIYKVGREPYWVPGMGVLGRVGLPAVVVPHFDNAEGGTHDTRFCWLGERRFAEIRSQLPASIPIIGIDEHTACIVHLDDDVFTVSGKGAVTVIVDDRWQVFPSESKVPIDLLRVGDPGGQTRRASTQAAPIRESALAGGVRAAQVGFDEAIADRDARGAVAALLGLLDTLDSAADSDEAMRADAWSRARSMIVRLGSSVERGLVDPRETVAGFVETILSARDQARSDGRYEEADRLRQRLRELGVAVRDTREGTEWHV